MKLSNKVDRMDISFRVNAHEFINLLIVKFDVDLKLTGDKSIDEQSFHVAFNSDGKIESFPDIKLSSKSPMRYVILGKVAEEIMSYEGDRAKNTYDKAMDIINNFELEKDTVRNNMNYNSIYNKRFELSSIVNSTNAAFKRARNFEKKARLENELLELRKKEDEVANELLIIDNELNKIESKKRKAISELVM